MTLRNQFSKLEQSTALSKYWYVYYKFIDDSTGKLKLMPNIKAGANRYKTKKEKLQILIPLRDALAYLLEKGLNPYSDPDLTLLNDEKTDSKQKEAFEFALNIKKHSLNNTSYINFEGRINRFKKSFDESQPITLVTRKITNQYLNGILETSRPRNRNNSRIDLSSLFEVLANNEIMPDNLIKKINILKAKPERNKTYTPEMQLKIYAYLETNDPLLLLFVKFICYNFLRPVEVCRLKVGDLGIYDKKLYVRAKTKQ